jgi:hypothetical protein
LPKKFGDGAKDAGYALGRFSPQCDGGKRDANNAPRIGAQDDAGLVEAAANLVGVGVANRLVDRLQKQDARAEPIGAS